MTTEEKARQYASKNSTARVFINPDVRVDISKQIQNAYLAGAAEALRSQWISVEDRLPEEGAICLCAAFGDKWDEDKSTSYFTAQFTGIDEWVDPETKEIYKTPEWMENWDGINQCLYGDEVTHWLPIPPLPDTEQ